MKRLILIACFTIVSSAGSFAQGIETLGPVAKISFNNVSDSDESDGLTWFSGAPLSYGIYKTAGTWSAPSYQQLKVQWDTGIILEPGYNGGKSYVDIQGLGLRVTSGNVGIGTLAPENADGWAKVLEVKGESHAKMLVSSNSINTGIWSHDFGFYGAPSGGITGTATNHPFSIMTNKLTRMVIASNGNIGIGTSTPNVKLAVNGNIRAHEIKVETANWPDYVFAKSYQLPTLQETEKHIKEKGHLPGIPSAEEVKVNGIDLGEMNAKLLKKIEELTLHLIEIKKEVEVLKMQNGDRNL